MEQVPSPEVEPAAFEEVDPAAGIVMVAAGAEPAFTGAVTTDAGFFLLYDFR